MSKTDIYGILQSQVSGYVNQFTSLRPACSQDHIQLKQSLNTKRFITVWHQA
jgi:hypothetical protein